MNAESRFLIPTEIMVLSPAPGLNVTMISAEDVALKKEVSNFLSPLKL